MKISKPITIEKLETLQYPIIFPTWNGTPVPVMCRVLTSTQIQACGDFSLIETKSDKRNKEKQLSWKEVKQLSSVMYRVVEQSLVNPTYQQILELAQSNNLCKQIKNDIAELREKVKSLPFGSIRKELEEDIEKKAIWADMLLPDDFIGYIFSFAVGSDQSDIKKVSEDMLIQAAVLAEKWHKAPSDYLSGMFTEFNKLDIDRRALLLLHDKREKANVK